jgi:hypothetical protein
MSPLFTTLLPALVDLAVKSAAVLLLAALAAALLARASAAWRHLVWSLSVLGLLVLPIFSLALPAWRVSWLPELPASQASRPLPWSPILLAARLAAACLRGLCPSG